MKKGIMSFILLTSAVIIALMLPQKAEARDADGDIVVIVDPGHGGSDGGAYQNNCMEAAINWNMALALKSELETYDGVKVYLTRGSGEWHSNTGRGHFGESLGADLLISLHNNSGSATASGVEVYGTINPLYQASMQTLANRICTAVSSVGLNNRGYHTRSSSSDSSRDYYTLIDEAGRAGIPSMIVEHCYLSNSSDAAFISSVSNQYLCGAADAQAIAGFYGLSARTVAAGSSITLTRTYSAYMKCSSSGTYSSSNESVAHVRSDGLITATGEGTATITCTKADGTAESVTVTVPSVKMIGLAAGSATTFYSENNVRTNFTNGMMVKAIYSDGSAVQVNGYTLGTFPTSGKSYPSVASEVGYDVPVSYNGFSCNLRVYGWTSSDSTAYSTSLANVASSNTDILLLPGSYLGINSGSGSASETPQPTTAQVTEKPTEALTTEEATTKEEITEAPTEEITTEEESTAKEAVTKESTEQETTENISEDKDVVKDNEISLIVAWLTFAGFMAAAIAVTIIILRIGKR